jgi:hypothetical protein
MAGVRRWVFNVMAVVSLVICLATVGLWVRSYWVWDIVTRDSYDHASEQRRMYSVHSLHGRFAVCRDTVTPWALTSTVDLENIRTWRWRREPDRPLVIAADDLWLRMGFGWESTTTAVGARTFKTHAISVPQPIVIAIVAILPSWWLRVVIQRKLRQRSGLCCKCGYDLRASPERCPECGAENP